MWTTQSGKPTRRFSYLLLEEGDHYIQDWLATCRPGSTGGSARLRLQLWQQRSLKGRLRLCAKCLFFEPEYLKAPILMFRFVDVKKVEKLADPPLSAISVTGKWSKQQEGFVLETVAYVKMKEEGLDAPYAFEKKSTIWWFTLDYAPVQPLLQQVQELLMINALPYMERDMVLLNTASQREAQAKFDTSRLVDLSEHIIFDCPAAQVTPLVREPGRLVLTQARLYFQPLHNFNNDNPVRSQPYSLIVAVARRRHSLRHTGIEVFFKDDRNFTRSTSSGALADGASVFYTFHTVEKRDLAISHLLEQLGGHNGAAAAAGSLLEATGTWLQRVTAAWQARLVSNFDYLIYLNLAAGRSFCDLTQWPVMPWVLSDYQSKILDLSNPAVFRDLSKPIGALNPARLEIFRERYAQMPHDDPASPPFLYGTHYSTPGYVLYYVVRAAPAHMLRLQNGRFDSPDRLFVSIGESWESVLSNPADLKELIPEFYAPPSDFLVMRPGLNLGVRQNGNPVGDVVLPPWAKSPDDFIVQHRQALECERVSLHLHEWIDLIFGFKQQGEAALAADNLFHHLTYEGAVDLDTIDDPTQRAGIEAQINEFGQAPRQLFTSPHPARLERKKGSVRTFKPTDLNKTEGRFGGLSTSFLSQIMALAREWPLENGSPKDFVGTPSEMTPRTPTEMAQFSPIQSPATNLSDSRADIVRSSSSGESVGLESVSDRSEADELEGQFLEGTAESFDGNNTNVPSGLGFEVPESPFDAIEDVLPPETAFNVVRDVELHLSLENTSSFLSQNASAVRPSTGYAPPQRHFSESTSRNTKGTTPWHWMFRQRLSRPEAMKLHRGPVNALTVSAENASESLTMYSVGKDGFIKVYSISEGFQVRSTKLGTLPLAALALASSSDAYPTVLAGSYDDCVYAYSVDYGRALGKIRVHEDSVSCVKISGSSSQRMVTGSWDATVKVWSIEEGRCGWASIFSSVSTSDTGHLPEAELEHEAAVWSLDVAEVGALAVSGAEDGTVIAWDLRAPATSMWQHSTGGGPAAGLKLTEDNNQVVVASHDGTLHVLEVRKGGATLATKNCGSPLKCCEVAGSVAIAGSTDGSLHFWPFEDGAEATSPAQEKTTNNFLDYSPIHDHKDAVNCITIARGNRTNGAKLATSSEDCSIQVYRVG
ncbi:unnamed protein product [Calypogeia fissa]